MDEHQFLLCLKEGFGKIKEKKLQSASEKVENRALNSQLETGQVEQENYKKIDWKEEKSENTHKTWVLAKDGDRITRLEISKTKGCNYNTSLHHTKVV